MTTALENNVTWLKLSLMSKGIRLAPDFIKRGLPRYVHKRASLSEGRCFELIKGSRSFPVNLAVYEEFVKDSPYFYDHRKKVIMRDGAVVIEARLIEDPSWYSEKLPDGTSFSSLVQLHGKNILATALTGICRFKLDYEGCKFCALTPDPNERTKSFKNIAEVISILEARGENYSELNINAGTVYGDDCGAEMYEEAIATVREKSGISIYAQLCPPKDLHYIKDLKNAGLNTISFNIEVFDEGLRKEACPGKSRIPVKRYLESLSHAAGIFGKNQVSSWLIAGLEPKESLLRGAREIARAGAIPFITVFRPLMGSEYQDRKPPEADWLMEVFEELGRILQEYGLDPAKSASGCAKCNCCSAGEEVLVNAK
ncbi:MAG: radical SAM protein [Nitrospirota bacterium]